MTGVIDFDPGIAGLFSGAPAIVAPDRVLAGALDRIDVTPQDRVLRLRPRTDRSMSSRVRSVLVASAVLALIGGTILVGAWLSQHLSPPAPRLLVVRAVAPLGSGATVAAIAIGPGGTEETLATFGEAQLGGSWTGQTVTYSGDGRLSVPTYVGAADNQFAIVDLRDPAAPPRYPDAVGSVATWRPDGRLAFDANDGTIAVYDLDTGGTSRVAISDGETPQGALEAVDVGLGPHRDRADGTRLGEPLDVQGSHPDERVTDYAAARDGGRWVLLETRADGPSTVRLVHVASDGTERDVISFPVTVSATYSNDGGIAAIAPDDSRIVVVTKDGGSDGPQYLVDPQTGRIVSEVHGMIVGWLGSDDLTKPRLGDQPVAATPTAARGEWARILDFKQEGVKAGPHRLQLGFTQATLDAGSSDRVTVSVTADGPDRLRFTQLDAGLGCEAGSAATYRWARTAEGLTLTAESDGCPARRALLEGPFEPNLPYRGNWEPRVPASERFYVPELAVRLTIPPSGPAFVWDHGDPTVSLANADSNLWAITRVDRRSHSDCGDPIIPAALDGVLGYLESLTTAGVMLVDRTPVTVAGLPGVRGTLRLPSDPSGICGRWPTNAGGWSVHDGESITLVEAPGGRVYSILSRGDATWTDALTASLEFPPDARN